MVYELLQFAQYFESSFPIDGSRKNELLDLWSSGRTWETIRVTSWRLPTDGLLRWFLNRLALPAILTFKVWRTSTRLVEPIIGFALKVTRFSITAREAVQVPSEGNRSESCDPILNAHVVKFVHQDDGEWPRLLHFVSPLQPEGLLFRGRRWSAITDRVHSRFSHKANHNPLMVQSKLNLYKNKEKRKPRTNHSPPTSAFSSQTLICWDETTAQSWSGFPEVVAKNYHLQHSNDETIQNRLTQPIIRSSRD